MARRNRRKSTVPMSWLEFVKNCFKLIGKCVWNLVCLLRLLDPRYYMRSIFGRHYYARTWKDTLGSIFRSEESSQREILHWVQTQIPGMNVINFTTCWIDGIALCALVENLFPGACPRYDLLKSLHHVNNCRLALKLANRHFNVPQDLISAEDIINSEADNSKLLQLLSYIHSNFARYKQSPHGLRSHSCVAKGSGLVAGMINTRCKIIIIVPFEDKINLEMVICGSNGEYHKELINSIHDRQPNKKTESNLHARLLWKIGASKILNNPMFLQDEEDSKKIQFEYHLTSEGHIEVNYVPKSIGNYKVSIKWKGNHVKGSPFSVLIAETLEKINEEKKGKFHKWVSETGYAKNKCNRTPRIYKQDSDSSDSTKSTSQKSIATAAAVLQRTSTLHRSLSRISGPPELTKQGTITRRRVLKRIVTKGGEEIVIHEAPVMENDASLEDVNENNLYAPSGKRFRRTSFMDTYPKSFDFEGSYESDSSCYNKDEPKKVKEDSVQDTVSDIISEILDDVFRQIKHKEHLFILEGKKKDFFSKNHFKESKRPVFFGRGKRFQSTGSLNIPTYDTQYHMSPMNDSKDEPRTSDLSESKKDEIELQGNLYKERRRLRLSEPSIDSLSTSIDESEIFSRYSTDTNSRYYTEDEDINPKASNLTSSDSSDCSRKGFTSNSSNESNARIALVTVHTQMKEDEKHSHKTNHEGKHNSKSLPLLKDISEFKNGPEHIPRKTLSEPSTPAVQSEDKVPFMRSFSANSKMTSCDENDDVFVNDTSSLRLLTSNSLQKSCVYISQKPVSMLSESIDLGESITCHEMETECSKRKKLLMKQAWGVKKLHMSKSMPSLTQMWKTVDRGSIATDDDRPLYPVIKKRATMGPGEMPQVKDDRSSTDSKTTSSSNSRSTSSSDSRTGSRRGSLARQHEVMSLQILCEETSEEKCDSPTDSDDDEIIPPEKVLENNKINFNNEHSWLSSNKTRMDVSTQVRYHEIKAETGWVSPNIYLLKRRRPVKIEEVKSLIENVDSSCSHSERYLAPSRPADETEEKSILSENTESQNIPVNKELNVPNIIVPRQSTIDTVDSGIADESLSRTMLSRRPNKYLNGHKVISRNRYRGQIKLDPKLVKQCSTDESDTHKHLRRYVNMWNDVRASSQEDYPRKWKKLGTKVKPNVISKRVKFSRKIFVYRRSTSSRSKTSSQSSRDSYPESNSGTDRETTLQLTRTFQVGPKRLKRKISMHKPFDDSMSSISISSPEVFSHSPMHCMFVDHNRASNKEPESEQSETGSCDNNAGLTDKLNSGNESLQSSLESDGFGLTSSGRMDLLNELNCFRKLSDVSEVPSSVHDPGENITKVNEAKTDTNVERQILDDKDENNIACETNNEINTIMLNNISNMNRFNSFPSSCEASSVSENIEGDAINLAMPLGEDYISFTGLLGYDSHQDLSLMAEVNKMLSESDKESEQSEGKSSVPDPDKCMALGPGLRYGQVGVKNNFQVHTRRAGNGCLGVSITGPRPHTVTETNVTYTGDDIYEVIYEVKHPGFYVITIKWSDFNIPESPFICKVTF